MKLTMIVALMTLLSSMAFAGPISSGGDEKAREFNCYSFVDVDDVYSIQIRDIAGTITEVSLWTKGTDGHLKQDAAVFALTHLNPESKDVQIDHEDFNGRFMMSVLPQSMLGTFSGKFPGTKFHKDAARMYCEELK